MKQRTNPRPASAPLTAAAPGSKRSNAGTGSSLPGRAVDEEGIPRLSQGWAWFCSYLSRPVNGASLAAFRIALGLIMALEALSLCRPSASTNGRIPLEVFYTGANVKFHFAYPGFHWLSVLPPHGIEAVVATLAVSGLMVALGLAYRFAAAMVFLSWGYLYAIESTRTYWMSYHYLELLTTFLLIWMPAARRFSLDGWLASRNRSKHSLFSSTKKPRPRTQASGSSPPGTVALGTLFVLRGQLIITYFYAGVAKLNADWLLDAQPVKYYLSQARWIDDYGTYLSPGSLVFLKPILQSTQLAYFLSWAGALFDLGIGFLLLFRRTRIFAMVLMLIFHGTNHFVIFRDIDWFPLLGVLTASIFFDADWPERVGNWLKRPRVSRPDWGWFFGGAILIPVVGAALGWKLPPSRPAAALQSQVETGRAQAQRRNTKIEPPKGKSFFGLRTTGLATAFVSVWLIWQALMPARGFLIPGDARFTWEGLSFSWRLKAEVYRCTPCRLIIEDPSLSQRDPSGACKIDWNRWRGEKVIYRTLTPGAVDWSQLPEVFVLLEPRIGQRILYNPFARSKTGRSEAESRARLTQIWQELYGHPPQVVLRTASPTETLSACAATLRARGYSVNSTLEAEQLFEKLVAERDERDLTSILRQTHPLALNSGGAAATPFLLVEDPPLARDPGTARMKVQSSCWARSSYTRCRRDSLDVNVGGEPLVIYTGADPFELKDCLPQASIFESQDHPERLAYICWNYLRELTLGEGMHLSMQPFLLREYARHIADLWEPEYGRRPTVHAETAVSLNFRPTQPVVDPQADLASVSLSRLRHNTWIKNLECPRIPRGSS